MSGQLRTTNLRHQAKEIIRASLITGEFETGKLYPVSHLSSQLGVSATPIREALLDLASDGLVEIVRNRGFRVPPRSAHDLDEIFELRVMLEVPAVGRVTRLIDAVSVSDCRRYARIIERSAAKSDIASFLTTDRLFHARLLESLGNRRLLDIVTRLRDQTPLYGLRNLAATGRLMASAREHTELLDAIVSQDPERARQMMAQHLKHTRGIWAGLEEQIDVPALSGADGRRGAKVSTPAGGRTN